LQILTYVDINDQKKLVLISASSDLGSESVTECCKQKKTSQLPTIEMTSMSIMVKSFPQLFD